MSGRKSLKYILGLAIVSGLVLLLALTGLASPGDTETSLAPQFTPVPVLNQLFMPFAGNVVIVKLPRADLGVSFLS
ncbi:MAG: hypothetical protein GY759_02380 [Chloroflexi bacterium]|nr:hypothetical protein [Chloroflexota bacterium]